MLRIKRTHPLLVVLLPLALGVSACGDGGDDDADAATSAGAAPAAATSEPTGTVTFDGEPLALSGLECNQIPTSDDAWRVTATVGEDGWLQLQENGIATLERGDESWSERGGDDQPFLDMGAHGAQGEVTLHLEGQPAYDPVEAPLEADITC